MNIFVLDRDIARAARYHSDVHIVKMPLEAAQILCSALHANGLPAPYKATHLRHPCVLWAAESLAHWQWLRRFGLALAREYRYRFGKAHGCEAVIKGLPRSPALPRAGWRDPPQAIPDAYRGDDVVAAYRAYYRGEKSRFRGKGAARWTRRRAPPFMKAAG